MLGVWLAAWCAPAVSPPSFNVSDTETLLIHAERLIVKPGVELEGQSVLVQDGVIVAVGSGLAAPEGAREISGSTVCAGFVDPWSSLGLDSASLEDQRTSPSTLSVDAVDRWSTPHQLEDALRGGVTSVRVQAGAESSIGGLGAVVRNDPGLDASHAVVLEDACLQATIGITRQGRVRDIFERVSEVDQVVGLVEKGRKYAESKVEYEADLEEWRKAIAEKEKELEKDFKKAKKDRDKEIEEAEEKGKEHKEKKYKEDKKPRKPKFDADDEVLARVAGGEVPLVVEIHRDEELRSFLDKTSHFGRVRMVLSGATEAAAHAEAIAERDVPVIVWPKPLGSDRSSEWEEHDLGLAQTLHEAGVTVLIGSGGSAASRDLRLLAALAVSRGLDRDAALGAITLHAANALDVGDRLGSVERGKDADLLILDGDPLDTTARIQYVVSQGRVVVEP